MARNTTTGQRYEHTITSTISGRGLSVRTQVPIGEKPGGGTHRADLLVSRTDTGPCVLISVKTQNTSGTAEEKLVYEIIKLIHAVQNHPTICHAMLVLGGTGWSEGMKTFISNCSRYVNNSHLVSVLVSTDDFITLVNRGGIEAILDECPEPPHRQPANTQTGASDPR